MSLRIIPKNNFHNEVNSTKFEAPAPSVSLPDTLRAQKGPLSIASEVNGRHPLEARVQGWEQTQHEARLEMYKRMFGAAEPIKRSMELKIVDETDFRPQALGERAPSLHKDILLGKEMSLDWEDVYDGFGENPVDFHLELERKVGMK